MVQYFKGDPKELKMKAVADPLFDLTDATLDDFYQGGFESSPFLLAMYDDLRVPFSERITRDSFVEFVKNTLSNFPFTGTFEIYLAVLTSIFGTESEIRLTVPSPGKLAIDVEAVSNSTFTFLGREFVNGAFQFFDVTDSDGDTFIFRGILGIDTEYELGLLFSELMPAGIIPQITLGFYSISHFVDDDGDSITDDSGLGIIFEEGAA